jgi:hypothetical protein
MPSERSELVVRGLEETVKRKKSGVSVPNLHPARRLWEGLWVSGYALAQAQSIRVPELLVVLSRGLLSLSPLDQLSHGRVLQTIDFGLYHTVRNIHPDGLKVFERAGELDVAGHAVPALGAPAPFYLDTALQEECGIPRIERDARLARKWDNPISYRIARTAAQVSEFVKDVEFRHMPGQRRPFLVTEGRQGCDGVPNLDDRIAVLGVVSSANSNCGLMMRDSGMVGPP